MRKNNVKTLVLAALFLALALVLPFLTGQIPEIGSMLCPMHIPAVRLLLRLALGSCGGLHRTAAALCYLWHAAHVSGSHLHGL